MKKLFLAAALALGLAAANPAQAQNASIEVNAGTNFENDASYGVTLGLDAPLSNRFSLGVEASAEDVFEDATYYGGVKATARVTSTTNLYASGGYAFRNDFDIDGYRLGAGIEQNMSRNTYVTVGYQYTDFGKYGNDNGGTIGLGVRF